MSIFKAEDIQVGMVLANDVINHRGMVLLRSGKKITEKHIRIFKTWGIAEVDVQDDNRKKVANNDINQIDPKLLQEAEDLAKYLFQHTDQKHPAVNELFNLCKKSILHKLLNDGKYEG